MNALLGEFQSANWTPNRSGCLQYFFGGISTGFLFPTVGLWGAFLFHWLDGFLVVLQGALLGVPWVFLPPPGLPRIFEYSTWNIPCLLPWILRFCGCTYFLHGDICMKKRVNAMDGGWIYRSREKQNQKKLQKNSGHTLSADDRWVTFVNISKNTSKADQSSQ